MTFRALRSRILAALGLAAFCTFAAAQGVAQASGTGEFTFTDIAMKVRVTPPFVLAVGVAGPNILCHAPRPAADVGAVRLGSAPYSDPGDLRGSLLTKVHGKSANALIDLLAAAKNASGRDAKVRELFGITQLSEPSTRYGLNNLDDAQMRLLQMGQEVSPTLQNTPTGPAKCYTAAQIDRAIEEGARVVGLLIQALEAKR